MLFRILIKPILILFFVTVLGTGVWAKDDPLVLDNDTVFRNPAGLSGTFSTQGLIDTSNEFFQVLGTNGRSCDTCHKPEEGWSVTPRGVEKRFKATAGTDPIFRTNDGSNSPNAKVKTRRNRRKAYSMLLNKGLIRVSLNVPENAEFELVAASDPYGNVVTPASESSLLLSMFRRPLPATNMKFLGTVMWDGREVVAGQSIHYDLLNQANNAVAGHEQGDPLTDVQRQHIVEFETSLYTAQVWDSKAGSLTESGVKGGPMWLSKEQFYSGINDFLGDSKTGADFDPKVFTLFDSWNELIESDPTDIRAAIARGQKIFNSKPLKIFDVPGINDSPDFGSSEVLIGTCSTCHNTPNVGSSSHDAPDVSNNSVGLFLDIGISDEVRRTSDLPLYTLRNKITGEIRKTSDPGRALITGRWGDIGKFKVPGLRGLAARGPYFHNGMAKELGNVLDFYNERFQTGLNNRERLDLILFLQSL